MNLKQYMAQSQQQVDQTLEQLLTGQPSVHTLLDAMRYSTFNGGKRIRPMLVYAACDAVGGDTHVSHKAACAVELIHAYSLIHDDLPAMDDDDLRRGKATCHKAYDEATAILAGDALQALAFQCMSEDEKIPADTRINMIYVLSSAAGKQGMVGGQAYDLASVNKTLTIEQLETMHAQKTGALIRASVQLGALCHPDTTPQQLQQLDVYARCIGLAFQVQDDILDVESDTETLGKQQGADIALNKPTYPALLGLDGAKRKATELHDRAQTALASFNEQANPLRQLASYIINRTH